jgi:lipoprotein-anchoring transpeptidase ErfK/SrfK
LTSTACNCVKTTSQGVSYRPRTPRGTFGFQRAVRYERSRSFHNALMNYALYVNHKPNSGIALHATYGDNVAKLGTPGSAGCMRLSEDHARALFDLVTKVGLKNAQVTIVDLQTKTGTLNVTP